MTEPTRDDGRDLLGAYVLDALDPDERALVDELLLTDASARAELHELQQGAAWLAHGSLRPPDRAWAAIAAEIDADRSLADDRAADPMPPPAPPASVTPICARHRPATRWLVGAAAAIALVVGAVGAVTVVNRSSGGDSVTSRYAAAQRVPDARELTLRATNGSDPVPVVVLPDRTGYLDAAALPVPTSRRDLQLWSITPDGPVSAGLLRGDGTVHEFHVAPGATALAVTNEPRGGSDQPTGTPIVSGQLGSA